MNRKIHALALLVFSCAVMAEHQSAPPLSVEVGSTLVGAATSAGEHENAGVAAFDVAAGLALRGGQFSLLIEADTQPWFTAATPDLSWVNHDLGTVPGFSQSQARISELHYDFANDSGDWSIGFIDSKAHIDGSTVANDDKTQFSNPAFVNNPTIRLPDNSLGLAWQRPLEAGNRGYSLLLAKDGGDGAFLAVESWWAFETVTARLGAWDNSHALAAPAWKDASRNDFGLYMSFDGSLAALSWNVRTGIARPDHSEIESFISVAAEIPIAANSMGIAVGYLLRGGLRGGSHFELYYRFALSEGIVITPCVQFSRYGDPADPLSTLTAGVRFRLNI